MKKLTITTLFLGALVLAFSAPPATAQVGVSVTIGGFYDELAPYGRWVDCRYGQCWVPSSVHAGWQPYSNGQWVYTEYGWTWVSDDPWGGNPYHYGTWASLDNYGWCWVPGTVWAPAWVTWNYSDRYVGWAPIPPTLAFGSSGYSGRAVVVSSTQYVFVPTNRFVGTNVSSVRVSTQQNATIFRQTKPVTGFSVSGGIVRNMALPIATIQRAAGSRIETHSIADARATPRSMTAGSSGKNQHMGIVASPRDVNAAVGSRKHTGSTSSAASGQHGGKPEAKQEASRPATQMHQGSKSQKATEGSKQKEHKSSSTHHGSSGESHGQSSQPTAQPRHESSKPPARAETHQTESHGQSSQPTAQRRHESSKPPARAETHQTESHGNATPAQHPQQPQAHTEAAPQTHHDQGQAASHAQPKQNPKSNKPAEKNKGEKGKGAKDQKEEKQ